MAQPDQMLTITGLLWGREAALAVMQRVRGWFGRRNVLGSWAYHLEVNPRKNGAHAHVWWRGDEVSRPLLADAAVACGAGRDVDVRRAFAPAGSVAPELAYGFKAILRNRSTSPAELTADALAYLDLNGGRLVTASHGFWIDWDGERVDGGATSARTVANGWDRPRPRSSFLATWQR